MNDMSCHEDNIDRPAFLPAALLYAGLFLLVLGAKLWLIRDFGSDLPYWDQWNSEAEGLLIPWFGDSLTFGHFFASHNEHRIVFTRLIALALTVLNGQWDAQLGMVVNASIHAFSAVALVWIMIRAGGWKTALLALPAVALAFALPFAWENTLAAFQSQFYLLFLFSLISIALLILRKPLSPWWFAGIAAAAAGIFTMASGFLAVFAVLPIAVVRIIREPRRWKAGAVLLAGALLVASAAISLSVHVSGHEIYKAQTTRAFIMAFGRDLAWPCMGNPWNALLMALPLALLALRYMLSKRGDLRAEELTLALGAWVVLQAAATAYARGGWGTSIASRYMDLLSIGMVVNVFSIVLLFRRHAGRRWERAALTILCAAWIAMCGTGLYGLVRYSLKAQVPLKKYHSELQVANVRAFVATDDVSRLEGKRDQEIPFPCPYYLAGILKDQHIEKILPASVRRPLPIPYEAGWQSAFARGGISPETPELEDFENSFGSWSGDGAAGEGMFESLPARAPTLPYLRFELTGFSPGAGLELRLCPVDGSEARVVATGSIEPGEWQSVTVRSPRGEFIVVASDRRPDAWLAFKEPVELGALSVAAEFLASIGPLVLLCGLIVTASSAVWMCSVKGEMK